MPSLRAFIQKYTVKSVTLDFCQYGEPWKKPTAVIGNFWDLSPLHRKCGTIKNKRSRTQRPHTALAGCDSSGCFWTLRAQPYPWPFAEVVATNAAIALQA